MCGIAGYVDFDSSLLDRDSEQSLVLMTETLTRRGPDEWGIWGRKHVLLGHRRLSVIDHEGGKQPMVIEVAGQVHCTISYSGEVYNYLEVRRELESLGHRFCSNSDTEVVGRSYIQWGEEFVNRMRGMFALALWDDRRECLLLVRDRLGIKPLFYHYRKGSLLFASEPKALFASGKVRPIVDLNGMRQLFSIFKLPGESIYRGVLEVRPGEIVRFSRDGCVRRRYWHLEIGEYSGQVSEAVGWVRQSVAEIVGEQVRADVPICTLLSGGLDSSVVTALVQREEANAGRRTKARSVTFDDYAGSFKADPLRSTPDEPFARLAAEKIGVSYREVSVSKDELLNAALRHAVMVARDAPGLGNMDGSLYLLCQQIKREATVALSGEGADEVFGGYGWFYDPERVWAGRFPWTAGDRSGYPPGLALDPQFLERGILASLQLEDFERDQYNSALREVDHGGAVNKRISRMQEITYLHWTRFIQLLLDRKDRMSMAVGLEVRVPFCDHRLAEFSMAVPWETKTFDGREKSLLRAAFSHLVPGPVANRVKSPYPSIQDSEYTRELLMEAKSSSRATRRGLAGEMLDWAAIDGVSQGDGIELGEIRQAGVESAIEISRWLEGTTVSIEWV